MSAVAAPLREPAPLAPPLVLRLGAFGALALFAGLRWAALVAPAASGRMAAAAAVAVAAAGLGHAARYEVHRGGGVRAAWRGRLAAAVLAVPAAAAVLALAGVSGRLLAPAHWDDLASGIGQGVQSLPGIGVPYRGVDPFVRIVLLAAGMALLLAAGALAVRALRRDRRPVGAALTLAAVYAIAVVERPAAHPYLAGALFTLLLGALLWGDRVERAYAAPAAAFVALAIGGGALAAPKLDAAKPWIDYQGIVESLSTPPAIAYSWSHTYGPLHWPRDNREMLRIAARTPLYWKAVDLDRFDGEAWRPAPYLAPRLDTEIAPGHPRWQETLRVTVRDLRSAAYVGAGTALRVSRSPRYAIAAAPGTFATGRDPLRRGDSYLVTVYDPHPTPLQLARAGSDYPSFAADFLSMDLPRAVGGPRMTLPPGTPSTLGPVHVVFQQFGLLSDPTVVDPLGRLYPNGDAILRRSAYAPMYDLALRLREESTTPYDLVRAVEQHLADGFAYTENPPAPRRGRPPLVSFLFDTKAGYCQHFSGAMALLLRMAGVPARVASGFSPGVYDAARREWVVHDVDAHSWVEVYFPRIGWVTFDPTPTVAPPHHQLAAVPGPPGVKPARLRPDARRADVPRRPAAVGPAAVPSRPVVSIWVVVLGIVGVAFAGGAAAVAVRARRGARAAPLAPELAELVRALRLTGRPVEPGVTLRALEERYRRHAPAAAAYIAAVRLRRYGGRTAPPTRDERRALRRELAAGLGFGGRLRAWLALPPGVH